MRPQSVRRHETIKQKFLEHAQTKHPSAVVRLKFFENKMAEIYRCAVGPQLYRVSTKNSRQVSVEWTLFYLENTILPFGFRDLLAYIY